MQNNVTEKRLFFGRKRITLWFLIGVFFVFVFFALQSITVDAADSEIWVSRYNGPENHHDYVNAIAIDPTVGNVYVTGYSMNISSGFDFATVAYNSAGTEIWEKRYNGLGNSDDQAQDIDVDTITGNVYVTGWTTGNGTGKDYATVAYDSAGHHLWDRTYNNPIKNGDDAAVGISINPITGDIIVTGYCVHPHTRDYTTLAYDSVGNLLWEAIYSYPGPFNDYVTALTVDSNSGNIYVTGYSQGGGISGDYATVAYSSSGAELWSKRFNGPSNGQDRPKGITVDPSSGNVYVTGFTTGIGTSKDYTTIAYDSTGVELWNKSYNGPGNGDDITYEVVVDSSSGNLYITGQSMGSGSNWDYVTLAYDSAGNELWIKRYNGPGGLIDAAFDIKVNSLGHVIVTGGGEGISSNRDYTTIAYNATGMEQWFIRYDGPSSNYDIAWTLLVDSSDDIYLSGRSVGIGTGYDYATIKYDYSYLSTTPYGVVRNINCNKLYNSIQEGVDDADNGDTLFVGNGIYYENLVIDKSLNLIGENTDKTIIDGKNSWYVVKVTADKVNISGFTIQNSSYGQPGLHLESCSNHIITNCKFFDNYRGIYLSSSSNNKITDCISYDNSIGMSITISSNNNIVTNCKVYSNNNGIALGDSSNNKITNCISYDNAVQGIVLWNESNTKITNCTVFNNTDYGIQIRTYSNHNTVNNCTTYNNKNGISLFSYAHNNTVTDCTTYKNDAYGILIYGAACDNTVTNCHTHNNTQHGVRIEDFCDYNTIKDCTILDNKIGIYMRDYCDNNLFDNCEVFENLYGIRFQVYSHYNTIKNCIIYDTENGIVFDSSNNIVSDCEVYNSIISISLRESGNYNTINNCIVHNSRDGIKTGDNYYNTIINSTSYNNNYFGFQLINSSNSTLTKCKAYDNPNGIVIKGYSVDNNVTSCNVIDNTNIGILLDNSINNEIFNNFVSGNLNDIYLYLSNDNDIVGNTIIRNMHGVYLYKSNTNNILDNSIEDKDIGIYIDQSQDNIIDNNVLTENGHGIILDASTNNMVSQCTVLNNTDKGVSLTGASNENTIENNYISGNQFDIYLEFSQDNDIVENTIIRNMNGVYLYNANNNYILDNTIIDKEFGIFFDQSHNNIIENTLLKENTRGITIEASQNINVTYSTIFDNTNYGIYLGNTSDNFIRNCHIYNNNKGVYLNYSNYNNISNNNISSNQFDLFLSYSNYNEIVENTIINNMHGVYLFHSDNNDILDNSIEEKDFGISDPFSNYNTIKNNYLHNNLYGIHVEDSQNNIIIENSLSENVFGISIDEDSTDNEIYYNNFVDNNVQAEDAGDNTWDDGAGTGNFWSDYTGEDTNGDGIGETPYEELDQYPIIDPPSNSPPVADADGPYFGAVGQTIIFDASDSYDFNEEDVLQYRWDFDADGICDTEWSSNPITSYTWGEEYTGNVVVEVSDGEYIDTDSSTITVRTIEATIDFNPDTLNLKSKGKPVTVYIELPEGYDVNDIERSTILLNGIVQPEANPWEIGDVDKDGIPDLMIKFNRSSVQAVLKAGESESILITGLLNDCKPFGGYDLICVIKEK